MKALRIVILDRDPAVHAAIESLLKDTAGVEIVGRAAEGRAAVSALQSLRPDLAFLGARLPGLSGFEIVESVTEEERPAVIIVAAGPEDAAHAFDAAAVDYLVTPLRGPRFHAALERARRWIRSGEMNDLETRFGRLLEYARTAGDSRSPLPVAWPARISLKVEGDYHIVGVRDIIWVEAQRDFVKVCVAGQVRLIRESLQQFEKRLDPARFSRIHRSFLVNLEHVVKISAGRGGESTLWMSDGAKVPASRSSRPNLAALTSRAPSQILEFARAFEISQKDDGASAPMIPALIYVLCGLTSAVCAALLLRSYARSGVRLLLWSGIGFSAFTANNILLFLDLIIFTHTDLSPYRNLTVLLGIALFLYGMIWET